MTSKFAVESNEHEPGNAGVLPKSNTRDTYNRPISTAVPLPVLSLRSSIRSSISHIKQTSDDNLRPQDIPAAVHANHAMLVFQLDRSQLHFFASKDGVSTNANSFLSS